MSVRTGGIGFPAAIAPLAELVLPAQFSPDTLMLPPDSPSTDPLPFPAGDPAVQALKWQHVLSAYAFSLLRDWGLAEDTVQETVLLILRRPELYEPDRPLLPWLRGIVRNKCLNLIRSRQREVQDETAVFASLVDESMDEFWDERAAEELARRLAALRFCMEKLPQPAGRLLYDFYVGGEAGKTLAERENLNFSNLRSQLHRLKKRLRECVRTRLGNQVTDEEVAAWDVAEEAFYPSTPGGTAQLATWLRGEPGRPASLVRFLLEECAIRVAVIQFFELSKLELAPDRSCFTTMPSVQPEHRSSEKIIPVRFSRWIRWGAGIAAALTLCAAAWWFGISSDKPIGRIVQVTGIAWSDDAGGSTSSHIALMPGDPIYSGSRIRVGARSALQVQLLVHRGVLTLFDRTTLDVQEDKPGHFKLVEGGFRASFEKQRPDSPVIFETPHSVARVVGTEFTLALGNDASRLEVTEGQVQLTSAAKPVSIDVKRREAAVIGSDANPRLEQMQPSRLDEGLLAHWTFDEARGERANDAESASLAMQLEGAAWKPGLRGSALYFDGSSYSQAMDDPGLDLSGPFTLSAWIWTDGGQLRSGIISKYRHQADDLPSERAYALKLYYGSLEFIVSADGTMKERQAVRGATQIPKHRWVHVAAVFEPGKCMRLYVDGKLDGQATEEVPKQIATVAAPLWLGATYRLSDRESFFQGALDDVRIYRRALTNEEVQELAVP